MPDAADQKPPRTVAVILAGGTGSRVGLGMPKQLVKIAGKSIIEHTLRIFDSSADIDDIVIFMKQDYIPEVRDIVHRAKMVKVRGIHPGGVTRNETTRQALDVLSEEFGHDDDTKVLIHDAVRPLVSHRVISDCITALDDHGAVDVAVPASDTVIVTRTSADGGAYIEDIPDRSSLQRGQTPQAFRLSAIRRAYERAAQDPDFTATDDCAVVLRYLPDVPIRVVCGEEHNVKVTHPVDLFITDKLFQLQSQLPPASSSDSVYAEHLSGKVLVVFGGSYGIGADVADLAEQHGARVFRFSRTLTGTHVEIPDHVEAALRTAHAQTGRIDFIVNTAGILTVGNIAETDAEEIHRSTAVNYLAPVFVARAGYPYLRQSKGQLLMYTSSSYTRGREQYVLYSSAKAATVNLTQGLAEEWASAGIRVNCINPERTRTPMRLSAFGEEPEESLLTPEAVAQTSVDVLLSDATGHVFDVRRQTPMEAKAPGTTHLPMPELTPLA